MEQILTRLSNNVCAFLIWPWFGLPIGVGISGESSAYWPQAAAYVIFDGDSAGVFFVLGLGIVYLAVYVIKDR